MIIDDERAKLQGARIELFGSDISERSLEKAQSGLYTQFEIQRGLPIRLLVRHFEKADEMWSLSARIRQMVRWRRINLLADLRALGQFDIIFCRNVVSSFDEPTRRRVLDQLARALPEDGCLVLGLDETVAGVTDTLRPVAGLKDGRPEARARIVTPGRSRWARPADVMDVTSGHGSTQQARAMGEAAVIGFNFPGVRPHPFNRGSFCVPLVPQSSGDDLARLCGPAGAFLAHVDLPAIPSERAHSGIRCCQTLL